MLWRLRSFPDFVEPCLPSQVERPPSGHEWIHEIKHDGFPLLARRGATSVRLFPRNGHDWTERFPLIVEALNDPSRRPPASSTERRLLATATAFLNLRGCAVAAATCICAPSIWSSWTGAICGTSHCSCDDACCPGSFASRA